MFNDVVYDSPWANRSHRGWTTMMSFVLQAIALAVALLLSFFYSDSLPQLRRVVELGILAPPAGPSPAPAVRQRTAAASQSNLQGRIMLTPSKIPKGVSEIIGTETSQSSAPPGSPYIVGAIPGTDSRDAVPDSIGRSISAVIPRPPVVRAAIASHSMEAYLVRRVQPEYPPLAKAARIQGAVLVGAFIARDGSIENLKVLSGHPMLVRAALDAIRQWRYRPYFLNGEPVEVETQITVNFVLNGG